MIHLRHEKVQDLRAHAAISSAFEAKSRFDVVRSAGDLSLVERATPQPFTKDYDSLEDPLLWPHDFDTSKWVLISAFDSGTRIGGVIGAIDTPGVHMLEGRRDLVVLWDLRVEHQHRRRSVARKLFEALELWALQSGCRELKVETQDTNVTACHFYAAMDCVLAEANADAYLKCPGEVQLIWRKPLPLG